MRRLKSLGTCWKARLDRACLLRDIPSSIARISYSRDLTKLSTSSCPFLKAFEDVWVDSVRASRCLARWSFLGRFLSLLRLEAFVGGSLRFFEPALPVAGVFGGCCWAMVIQLSRTITFQFAPRLLTCHLTTTGSSWLCLSRCTESMSAGGEHCAVTSSSA